MKLSVSIMMHPSRKQFLPYLQERLGNPPVAMDQGKGIWDTRERATRLYDPSADFHLVVQDDALICDNFFELADAELKKHPDCAFSFYYGSRKRKEWVEINRKALRDGGYMGGWYHWGVAICLPVSIIEDCLKCCSAMNKLKNHDDTRIANFIRSRGMKVWYPVPSLIDHRTDTPSLMENHEGPHQRQALKFLGE